MCHEARAAREQKHKVVVVKVVRKSRSDAEFQCAVVMEQATGDQGRGA